MDDGGDVFADIWRYEIFRAQPKRELRLSEQFMQNTGVEFRVHERGFRCAEQMREVVCLAMAHTELNIWHFDGSAKFCARERHISDDENRQFRLP